LRPARGIVRRLSGASPARQMVQLSMADSHQLGPPQQEPARVVVPPLNGWLILLAITWIASALSAASAVLLQAIDWPAEPPWQAYAAYQIVINSGFAIVLMILFIDTLQRRRRLVLRATITLIAIIVLAVVVSSVWMALLDGVASLKHSVGQIIFRCILCGAWLAYLKRSVRLKITFLA
jgi:hypothetical protein